MISLAQSRGLELEHTKHKIGENMNELIQSKLAIEVASKTLTVATLEARNEELLAQLKQAQEEVETYRTVLASDCALQELFEEVKNKNEVTN